MQLLSSRYEGLRELPQLHLLVQDTVSVTLREVEGMVEERVNQVLDNQRMDSVQEMVVRLLTHEVIMVTAQSAEELSKRRLETMELSQQRGEDALKAVQKQVQGQFEGVARARQAFDARFSLADKKHEALAERVAALEDLSSTVGKHQVQMTEMSASIIHLEEMTQGAERQVADVAQSLEELERACDARYVQPSHLRSSATELARLVQQRDDATRNFVEETLRSYPTTQALDAKLDEESSKNQRAVQNHRDEMAAHAREVFGRTNQLREDFTNRYIPREDVESQAKKDREAHATFESDIRSQMAMLQRQMEAQAGINHQFTEDWVERSKLFEDFAALKAHTEETTAALQEAAQASADNVNQINRSVQEQKSALTNSTDWLGNVASKQATMAEAFGCEKQRFDSLFKQHQQGAKDLSYISQQIQVADVLSAEIKKMQTEYKKRFKGLEDLRHEVEQWTNAISEQKSLRFESDQLRQEVASLREKIEKLDRSQHLSVESLRDLHFKVFNASPRRESPSPAS